MIGGGIGMILGIGMMSLNEGFFKNMMGQAGIYELRSPRGCVEVYTKCAGVLMVFQILGVGIFFCFSMQ
jgi:hypothetical protein